MKYLYRLLERLHDRLNYFDLKDSSFFSLPLQKVCDVHYSDFFFGRAEFIAAHMLKHVEDAANAFMNDEITLGQKEIVAVMERLLRAFLTGEVRTLGLLFSELGITGPQGSLNKFWFPYVKPNKIDLANKFVDWREISYQRGILPAMKSFINEEKLDLHLACRSSSIKLADIKRAGAIQNPFSLNDFMKTLTLNALSELTFTCVDYLFNIVRFELT